MKYVLLIAYLIIHEIMYIGCNANGCFVFGFSKSNLYMTSPPRKFQYLVRVDNILMLFLLIWNFGLVVGIALFVFHFLSFTHNIISWVFSIFLKTVSRHPIDNASRIIDEYYIPAVFLMPLALIPAAIVSVIFAKNSWIDFSKSELLVLGIIAVTTLLVGVTTRWNKIDIG